MAPNHTIYLFCALIVNGIIENASDDRMKDFTESTRKTVKNLFDEVKIRSQGPTDETRYETLAKLWYPRTDEEKKKAITKLWNDYYICITEGASILGKYDTPTPVAVAVLDTSTVHLDCLICMSPDYQFVKVSWFKKKTFASPEELVEEDDLTIIQDDGTLSIYLVAREDAGIYWCRAGDTISLHRYLHVFGEAEPVNKVRNLEVSEGPHPAPVVYIEYEYVLSTVWSKWNKCTRCGRVGKRTRFGACFVSINKETNHEPEAKSILEVFEFGLPCRSPLLPKHLGNMDAIKKRANEIMVDYCHEPCIDTIFQVKDENGKIIQSVNNTAGEFSTLQGPPRLPPMIMRKMKFPRVGEELKIKCPSSQAVDTPTEWLVNKKKRINSFLANSSSHGRVYIDARDRIVIKRVEESDAHIYTCFQNQELAGSVIVIPIKAKNPKVLQVDGLLFAILVTVSMISYVLIRLYRNHKLLQKLDTY